MPTNTKPRHRAGRPATGHMAHIALRLPSEWVPALDKEAEARGHTRSSMARWIVMEWLKEARHDAS